MSNLVEGVSKANEGAYLRRMNRLKQLTGIKLLNELVAYDPESKEDYGKLHGRQNKRKGTAWKKRHTEVRKARKRNWHAKRR